VHRGREKCLVTLNRFSWTSPECWQHQSDCSTFNNCLYHPYWSHDQYSVNENENGFVSYMSLTNLAGQPYFFRFFCLFVCFCEWRGKIRLDSMASFLCHERMLLLLLDWQVTRIECKLKKSYPARNLDMLFVQLVRSLC